MSDTKEYFRVLNSWEEKDQQLQSFLGWLSVLAADVREGQFEGLLTLSVMLFRDFCRLPPRQKATALWLLKYSVRP